MLASGVWGGAFTKEYAYSREDMQHATFGEELERIGYKGVLPCDGNVNKLAAHFELHIEHQMGKISDFMRDASSLKYSVMMPFAKFNCSITGQDCHAGTTPMRLRKNALHVACVIIDAVNSIALRHENGVATVGVIESKPQSINTVPGSCFFTVDLRHPDDDVLSIMKEEFERELADIAKRLKVAYTLEEIWNCPATKFHPSCIEAVKSAVAKLGYPAREITSGAGHDSVYTSRHCPTSMVFIPCLNGISHNELESAEKEDCAMGANVLLNAVLAFDENLRT
ncbi:hypothetical protein HDU93_009202 [Gonapodya sp. JEL0774]|nr:hypothetical protein HDU93_009202 [Gonapodya sp. JEL0774]